MPMVPDTFAPGVSQGEAPMVAASGPWVSPVRNAAPGLLQQSGQTLTEAGDTAARLGNTIGDRVQETMDDAQTKAAETQFLKSSLDILNNPQGGYLYTRGMNAQTQWNAAAEALSKARQDARATLTNPIQERMFDQVTNDHLLTFGRQMNDHQHDQVTQYGIQQGQDRADSMNILARMAFLNGRMDDYQKYASAADNEVMHVASLNGAAPDSDVAQAMLRAKRSDLIRGITIGLIDNHKYDQAKQFFDSEQGNIDARSADVLGNVVKSEYDRNLTVTKGDAFLAAAAKGASGGAVPYTYGAIATGSTINPMRITDVPGSPRPDGRTHDGYDIAMPVGTGVTSPLDGKVVKVWNDDKFGGGLSMRVQLADGNTLGVAHLSSANLKEGDTVNRGQVIALSGKSGNATGAVLHVALENPEGKYIDYFSASQAQPDPADKADPNVLQRAIDMAKGDSSLDPYQQRQIVRYMEMEHTHERQIQNQQYYEVKQQVVDLLAQNGGNYDALPSQLKSQLRPSDALSFQQMQDAPRAQKNDVDTLANWIQHPEQQTVANVKAAYVDGRLSDAGYLSALRGAMSIQANDQSTDPQKVLAVSVDNNQIDSSLLKNGFQNLVNFDSITDPKDRDAARNEKVQLVTTIRNQVDAAQTESGKALSRDQKQQIIDQTLMNKAFVMQHRTLLPNKEVELPLFEMAPDQLGRAYVKVGNRNVMLSSIPPAQRTQAITALQRRRMPVTEQAIADLWVKAGMPGGTTISAR